MKVFRAGGWARWVSKGLAGCAALGLLAAQAFGATQNFLCARADAASGTPDYLLILQIPAPGQTGSAIILERNLMARSPWRVSFPEAKTGWGTDGALKILGADDPAQIDWTALDNRDQCFSRWEAREFTLKERASVLAGSVLITHGLARHPTRPRCPNVVPGVPYSVGVSCKAF